jgi:peptidoglycan/LPS O-acetylase OafA/YrhL
VLRAVACLLVAYCHLIGYRAPSGWFVEPYIDQFIRDPLQVMWNFGYLGVAIFFVISGFIITHVAQREGRAEFAVKRLFRIYPPFLLALAVAVLLTRPTMSPTDLLWEASLFGSSYKVIGPSYTLVIELMFYALATMLLPLLRSRPIVSTAIVALLPAVIRFGLRNIVESSGIHQLSILLSYQNFVSIFAVGMAIYYASASRISLRAATALGALAWCSFVWSWGPAGQNFEVNTLYAIGIFLTALWASPRPGPSVFAVAEGSYSIYLLHAPVGMIVLDRLEPVIGYSGALIICVAVVAVACRVSHAYVEKPSQVVGRLLIRRMGLLSPAAPAAH